MTYKTSLFNKGLFRTNIKRFWWISALYTFILFFAVPFQYMMFRANIEDEWKKTMLEATIDFFSGRNDLQTGMIAVLPTALAVLLFRYLMTGKAAAMIHSLPYNRRTLYIHQLAAGLLFLTAPVLLIGLIMTTLKIFTSLGSYYSMLKLLEWMGLTILFNTLFFSVAVFSGMFTGNSVAHITFSYILHLLPVGLNVLMQQNLASWLYGFSGSSVRSLAYNKLPWFMLFNPPSMQHFFTGANILAYLTATLLFFIAAGYAYKKRNLESAGDIIAFSFFRPIFKYGVTACGMLLGGLYFGSISAGSLAVFLAGYLLSSFLSYWIAEMLLHKSINVWHTYKGYLAYIAVVSLLLVTIHTDIFGYVHRMPEFDEIEQVYFGYHADVWNSEDPMNDPAYATMYYMNNANFFFKEPENIKNIMKLHEQLIQQSGQNMSGPAPYMVYMLKNGKRQVRQYPINEKQYAAYLKPIYESMEYKETRYPILKQKPDDIKLIQIGDNRAAKRPLILTNNSKLISLFQNEVRSMAFEELTEESDGPIYIQITDINDKSYHYGLRKNFESIIQWLKDKGYYENIVLLPEDIEYVVLRKAGSAAQSLNNDTKGNASNAVEIRDPKVLEELLSISESTQYYSYEATPLYMDFYIKGSQGNTFYGMSLSSKTPVSDELKKYMEMLN